MLCDHFGDTEVLFLLCSPLSIPKQMGCMFQNGLQAGFGAGHYTSLSAGGLWEEFQEERTPQNGKREVLVNVGQFWSSKDSSNSSLPTSKCIIYKDPHSPPKIPRTVKCTILNPGTILSGR